MNGYDNNVWTHLIGAWIVGAGLLWAYALRLWWKGRTLKQSRGRRGKP